jgi:hypothetical protein
MKRHRSVFPAFVLKIYYICNLDLTRYSAIVLVAVQGAYVPDCVCQNKLLKILEQKLLIKCCHIIAHLLKKTDHCVLVFAGISTWGKKVGRKLDQIKIGESSERLQYVVTAPSQQNRTESPMLLGASARMKGAPKSRTAHSSASSLVDEDNW